MASMRAFSSLGDESTLGVNPTLHDLEIAEAIYPNDPVYDQFRRASEVTVACDVQKYKHK